MAATSITPTIGETPPAPATLTPGQAALLEKEVVEYCERLYTSATDDDPEYAKGVKETIGLIDYIFENRHWQANARFSRNKPVLPKAARHFWENASLLTDLALDFQVQCFDHLDKHSSFEAMLNQLALHWAMRNQFESRTYDTVLYGLLHTGPCKVQWNSTLNGGMGDVQMVPIAPWQWVTLGTGADPEDAECTIYFPVVTKDHLIRRFGKTAMRVECDADFGAALSGNFNRPAGISKASWSNMGPALKRSLGIKTNAGGDDPYPKCVLKELWMSDDGRNEKSMTVTVGPSDSNGNPLVNWAYRVEPGMQLYPRGRVICIAGGCVLEDQPNPYWHSKKPFPVYRPMRVPWKMQGNSTVKSWVLMNTTINKMMGGYLDSLYSINEPTLVAPKGAFPAGDWEALDPGAPGGKIKVNNNAPWKPDFAKRAEFPFTQAIQGIDMISKEMDQSSGSSAMSQALNKKQVPGEGSLEMILSSRSLPVRLQSRALTTFIEDVGYMGIADMLQFYSAAHRVAILGDKGISPTDYRPIYGSLYSENSGMKPEEFVRRYQITIKPDSTLFSQKGDKVQIALALRKMGDLSQKGLMRVLDPNFDSERNQRELIEEAKIKIAMGAANAALSGKGQKKK